MTLKNVTITDARTSLTYPRDDAHLLTKIKIAYGEDEGFEYYEIITFDMENKEEVRILKQIMWYAGVTEVEQLKGIKLGDVEYKIAFILPRKEEKTPYCEVDEPFPLLIGKNAISDKR